MSDSEDPDIAYAGIAGFKPLLAERHTPTEEQLRKFTYPLIASPKLDGIRCFVHPKLGPVTRSLKKVPNAYIREQLDDSYFYHLDGELIVGLHDKPLAFNETTSGVMSQSGRPDFTYWVFDSHHQELGYWDRLGILERRLAKLETTALTGWKIRMVPYLECNTPEDVLQYEERMVAEGYEGIMLRSQYGKYKYGRSTMREQILVKMKRFEDAEAVITGYEPLYRNQNEAFVSETGHQKRSSHQENMVADDTRVGKFICRCTSGRFDGCGFSVGSGLDDAQRLDYRARIEELIGKTITFKYQPHGAKDAPRIPIFKGFRPEE